MEDPKSWGSTIGMLKWDEDKIVFSKRSLLEFLKQVHSGLSIDCQHQLWRDSETEYATFGKFSQAATDAAVADLVDAEIADPTTDSPLPSSRSTVPRPSRKVREAPGGQQNLRIFGEEYEETDALSLAPPRDGGDGVDVELEHMEKIRLHVEPEKEGAAHIEEEKEKAPERVSNPAANFRPSRKVREGPGGASSMGAHLFGGYEDETAEDRKEPLHEGAKKKQAPQNVSAALPTE
ncbi:hypothetical protein P7C73_g2365, partial [Tremellales sp. Uapishka_1]